MTCSYPVSVKPWATLRPRWRGFVPDVTLGKQALGIWRQSSVRAWAKRTSANAWHPLHNCDSSHIILHTCSLLKFAHNFLTMRQEQNNCTDDASYAHWFWFWNILSGGYWLDFLYVTTTYAVKVLKTYKNLLHIYTSKAKVYRAQTKQEGTQWSLSCGRQRQHKNKRALIAWMRNGSEI